MLASGPTPPIPIFGDSDIPSLVADSFNYSVFQPPRFLITVQAYDVLNPAVTAQAIPEPSTLTLCLVASLALAIRRQPHRSR